MSRDVDRTPAPPLRKVVPADHATERSARRAATEPDKTAPRSVRPLAPISVGPPRPGSRPLAPDLRRRFEPIVGADLGSVRVDTTLGAARDASAVGARAFTVGREIAFASGAFAPHSRAGRSLFVHELVHATRHGDGALRRDIDPMRTAERISTSSESGIHVGGINAHDWINHGDNARRLVEDLQDELAHSTIGIGVSELHWEPDVTTFVRYLLEPLGTSAATAEVMLERYLFPDQLRDAVNVGRDVAVMLFGPADYNRAVAVEIARRLQLRIHESLGRVAAAVARGRAREWSPPMTDDMQPPTHESIVAPTGLVLLDFAVSLGPRPRAGEAFTHPIDPYVATALRDSTRMEARLYRDRHPEELTATAVEADAAPLREVHFEFLAGRGLSSWIRVTDPVDATPAEVAFELYGIPEAACHLVSVPPLYAIPEEDIPGPIVIDTSAVLLGVRPPLQTPPGLQPMLRLEVALAMRHAIDTAPSSGPTSTGADAMRELLDSELGDEAALAGASRIMPTSGANDELIHERWRVIASVMRQLETPAAYLAHPSNEARIQLVADAATGEVHEEPYESLSSLDVRRRLTATRERVERRDSELAGRSGIAAIWDGQTAGQLQIVNTALQGATLAMHLSEQYLGTPLVYDLIRDIAAAYVDAAEVSDLYGPARARLDAAERRSLLFPVTAMELWLAQIRAALDEARTTEITSVDLPGVEQSRGVSEMDEIESQLRARLERVRGVLLTDPRQAQAELTAIFDEIQNLQTGTSIAMNLDTVDRVWQSLYDSLTFWGAARSLLPGRHGNDIISDAMSANLTLNDEWHAILNVWRSGDHAEARRQLEAKANGEWRGYISRISRMIEDHQTWDAVMNFAAMVGIALISGGIGAYVETGVGAFWGVTAESSLWARAGVAAVGTVTEASAFTAMSYPMQPEGTSLSTYFLTNLAFVGGARTIGRIFEARVGREFAESFAGQVANTSIQTVAMTGANLGMAQYEARRTQDRDLNSHEIASISLENVAFAGVTSLAGALLRTPLRNLRLRGHLDGLQLRHSRNLAAISRTMDRLPPGRPPQALRDLLYDQVMRALATEQRLSAEMRAIVEAADRMTDAQRARELRRWGITDETAAAYRSGTMPSEVLANLRTMQGIRVARSLEPVGNDFAVRPDMFDEAMHYFDSLPETEVVPGDLSMLVDPTMSLQPSGHGYLILSHGPLAVPIETGARSFVVRSAGEAPFRVYERSTRASGELAPHVELARSAAEVAEARGALPEGTASARTTSGGTAGHDPVRWGMPSPATEALRQRLLNARDIGAVQRTALAADVRVGGRPVDRAALQRVKEYLFNSPGIEFLPENHAWWQRLANGTASIRDIAILVHELAENARLEAIRTEGGFDYMGRGYEQMSADQQRAWREAFRQHYELDAHVRALEEEYRFLADQIHELTGRRVGRNIVAANDPGRAEGREHIREDGVPLVEHSQFEAWQRRGDEVWEIGSSAAQRLGLLTRTPTLRELIGAITRRAATPELVGGRDPRYAPPGAPIEDAGARRTGWEPPGERRGRGGATWDANSYPNPSVNDILTAPFSDGLAIGRDLFRRGRDLLARATSLTAAQKADAFEELARRINAVDPSWMANRGPATNAAGFFTGDARPFGFAIDNEGGVWGIMNFINAVSFGPGGVTIDYSQWQRVVP